jgi:hypothetical protein
MGHSHETRSQDQRANDQRAVTSPRTHGLSHATRGPEKRGCALYLFNFWVFCIVFGFFYNYKLVFNGFYPILGDLEPDLRPDIRRKLGG